MCLVFDELKNSPERLVRSEIWLFRRRFFVYQISEYFGLVLTRYGPVDLFGSADCMCYVWRD